MGKISYIIFFYENDGFNVTVKVKGKKLASIIGMSPTTLDFVLTENIMYVDFFLAVTNI